MGKFDGSGVKYGKPAIKSQKSEPGPSHASLELQKPSTAQISGPNFQKSRECVARLNQAVITPRITDQQHSKTQRISECDFLPQEQIPEELNADTCTQTILPDASSALPSCVPQFDLQKLLTHREASQADKHQNSRQKSKSAKTTRSPTTETPKSIQNAVIKPHLIAIENNAQQISSPRIEVTPPEQEASVIIDIQERIKQAKDFSLRKIAGRHRGKDKRATASLKDLDLARTPVDPNCPQASERHWSHDPDVVVQDFVKRFHETPQRPISPAGPLSSRYEILSNQAVQDSTSKDDLDGPIITNDGLSTSPAAKASTIGKRELAKSKWAVKKELRPVRISPIVDSNAWGSALASDTERDFDSVDKSLGKLLHKKRASENSVTLADWEGKLIPPPPDWANRPRFNNNNPHFKEWFLQHILTCDEFTPSRTRLSNGVPYVILPPQYLENLDYQADGLGLVKKTITINAEMAKTYGYADPCEVTEDVSPVGEDEFVDWGKMDMNIPLNKKFKDETTEDLVSNWLRHVENSPNYLKAYNASARVRSEAPISPQRGPDERSPPVPKLNIYLRPATKSDIPELTRIYNWHVKNGPRTPEVYEASEDDMRLRLFSCKGSRLPFIVAAKKCQRGSPTIDMDAEAEAFRNSGRYLSVQNIRRKHRTITRVEQLAGWVSAQDLTASDYVEHISAEIELYVDAKYRSMGVGRCLMDKMLEICDRTHVPQGGYEFHCAQEVQHFYKSGGERDIHKVFILLRKWKCPKPSMTMNKGGIREKGLDFNDEDDFQKWLGPWLESWQFKVEGILIGVGAKYGRYIDTVYLGRESQCQPDDGRVPNPSPDLDGNGVNGDDDGGNGN